MSLPPPTATSIEEAARRLAGFVVRTPLEPPRLEGLDPRIELRLKLENRQVTKAFKARGAWNQVAQLSEAERAAGVVATSSGNHGQALAWAARQAGIRATIVMPSESYPNKIEACRAHGAEVVLAESRPAAEELCRQRVAAGATLVHPYDADRTIEGAGTVGLEIAEDWPDVEVVVLPVGGGGLLAGSSLALRERRGSAVTILAVEPRGAPTLSEALRAGHPVAAKHTTTVQGLCPMAIGTRNLAVCRETVDDVILLDDDEIHAAQGRLLREAGEVVEPAGAAATAAVLWGLPARLLDGRTPANPLRVAAVVSGGNPDPEQLESLR